MLIADAVIADTYRTLDWGYNVSDFNDGFITTIDGHTPYGIKPFLTTRSASILDQLTITSVAEVENVNTLISLYPNPANEQINLRIESSTVERKAAIIDMTGKQQKTFILNPRQSEMDIVVADLLPGLYTLVISNSGSFITARFIKK
jgi:hypothetical protein